MRGGREKREERESESAPHETHKKAYPRSLSKRKGGEGGQGRQHGSRRTGTGRRLVGVASPARPAGPAAATRVGTGAGGVGWVVPAIYGRGSTAGRAIGRGLRLGRRAQQLPSSLAAN